MAHVFLCSFFLTVTLVLGGTLSGVGGEEDDPLCHPQCICLDSYFQCERRGLTAVPAHLPPWITRLDLNENELEDIDSGLLSSFTHLQSLSVEANNLTRVPSPRTNPHDTTSLQYLTQLSLSKNGIERLEDWRLGGFVSLRHLDLSRNLVQSLSNNSFPSPSRLHHLNLESNLLENLESGWLGQLGALKELHLAKNKIKFIARDALSPLKHLHKLDLSRNKLQMLDSLRFQELKELEVLNLRRNPLTNLSDAAFYGLEHLQHLYLEWGNIRVVEKRWLYGLKDLRTLNLSHNLITHLEEDSCEFLQQLQILDLSWNEVRGVSKKTFAGLSSLRTLDLSVNQVVELEAECFQGLEQLETLDLSENRLSWAVEDLAAPFKGLKTLMHLNLAQNQIHFLHADALKGLSALRHLNLSSNPISWLSEKAFLPVPGATLLLSHVNSFLCDCESLWLQARLNTAARKQLPTSRRAKDKVKTVPGPLCSFPPLLNNKALLDLRPEQLSCPDNSPKPMFLSEPLTQVFLVEGNGSLECSVQSYTPSVRIQWRKDHQELPKHLDNGVKTRMESGDDDVFVFHSRLEFVNVSWAEVGCYQCVARNDLIGVVYSAKANITLHVFPSFVKRPSNVTVRLGSNAKLECGAKGYPAPEIAFQKDGGEDFPAALDRRFHVMPNDDSFFIMEVKLADMGVYSCSARNPAGEIRANASVTVYETPSFSEAMEDESAVEGSNAMLACLAEGSPKPLVTWMKEGVPVVDGGRVHLTENASLLLIKDVQPGDAGHYECLLTNAVGTARGVSTLTVLNSSNVKTLSLDNAAMTIIFIIVAVLCVVVTSAAWVVVIYRTRKRIKTSHSSSAPLRHSKFEDFERELTNFPLPYNQMAKVICGDGDSSESSSGKDSGCQGDDVPESMGGDSRVGVSMESFSTFGTRAPPSGRWSSQQLQGRTPQPRIDLKVERGGGKGKGKPVALPVPPSPFPQLLIQLPPTSISIHSDRPSPRSEDDVEVEVPLLPSASTLTHVGAEALSTSTPV